MAKCPNCGFEISYAVAISKCWQKAYIDEEFRLKEYSSVEEILETLLYVCPDCDKAIDVNEEVE